ncbi:dihydrofolate reductase family protein [Rhodopila sp.]|jgi:dihydrofolate reductase|uniref:dihydrofolate reductase family protein n=1 Tax=Rhodopila sp. TaxID=2480087 RepID=UPI002CBC13B4|nr:dihydrofolate reductase family protein [Rhodopila sp.]HVZ06583.1 dihydrofolate reductase family protein [Rhodopila sp.]
MRKLILKMSTSLNGFVAGPGGELDWMFTAPDGGSKAWQLARAWDASLHLMGRRTFEDMKGHWPTSDDTYAGPMNAIPKSYFSRHSGTERQPRELGRKGGAIESWDAAERLTGDLAAGVERLKAMDGKPIIAWGGAGFARSLVPTGLIDEYQFLVHPVALPKGLEVFSGLDKPLRLDLVALERFDSGIVAKTFRPI